MVYYKKENKYFYVSYNNNRALVLKIFRKNNPIKKAKTVQKNTELKLRGKLFKLSDKKISYLTCIGYIRVHVVPYAGSNDLDQVNNILLGLNTIEKNSVFFLRCMKNNSIFY